MIERENDRPAGTEEHPPAENPERQGPDGAEEEEQAPSAPPPSTGEPAPEGSPGEPGVTSPRR